MIEETELQMIDRELAVMQSFAERFASNVARLREKLQPVSTGRSKKKITDKQAADILTKRRQHLLKK